MKQYFTRQEIREVVRGGTRIAPGIWQDRDGALHFSVPDLLDAFGWPDNAQHRAMVDQVIREVMAQQFPDAAVIASDLVPDERPQ